MSKYKMSKKKLQERLDELDAQMLPGNPYVVANALRKAAKKRGLRVLFGLIFGKKEYDATLFLNDGSIINFTIGSDRRKIHKTMHIKYEDEVVEALDKAISDHRLHV